MKKLKVSALVSAILLSVPASAEISKSVTVADSANIPVRLVIKQKDTVFAQSQDLTTFGQVVESSNRYTTMVVPEAEAESILAQLNQRTDIEVAERDYVVTTPKPIMSNISPVIMSAQQTFENAAFPPNDTYFGNQTYWQDQGVSSRGRSSILAARSLSEQNVRPVVAVLDSGFVQHNDLVYAGGYSFSTVYQEPRSSDYLMDETNCSDLHGTAVAGIIGATTDNSYGMAGIVDADIYAGRVMNCGSGLLSDSAEAIRWAAGDPGAEGTPLPRAADVINLSLAANTDSCPFYLQDAINYAVSKGSVVVVAAGNDGIDAANASPANCDNVITVGSVTESGAKSDFSNFGPKVDVSAMGELVLTLNSEEVGYWTGTSFSSPLTAGVIALAKQKYPMLTNYEIEPLLKSTSGEFSDNSTNIGHGIVNAVALTNRLDQLYGPQEVAVSHAIKTGERCQTEFYSDLFIESSGGYAKLCGMYEVDATDVYREADEFLVVFSVPKGESLTVSNANAYVRRSTKDDVFLVPNVDPDNFDYGLQVCDADGVYCRTDNLTDLNIQSIARPVACTEL